MNANELAKELSEFMTEDEYTELDKTIFKAATMLRQQQAENEMLRKRFGEELDAHHSALRKISKLRKAQEK